MLKLGYQGENKKRPVYKIVVAESKFAETVDLLKN